MTFKERFVKALKYLCQIKVHSVFLGIWLACFLVGQIPVCLLTLCRTIRDRSTLSTNFGCVLQTHGTMYILSNSHGFAARSFFDRFLSFQTRIWKIRSNEGMNGSDIGSPFFRTQQFLSFHVIGRIPCRGLRWVRSTGSCCSSPSSSPLALFPHCRFSYDFFSKLCCAGCLFSLPVIGQVCTSTGSTHDDTVV